MLFIKHLCLIIFIIITILFTVGYTTQPIYTTQTNKYLPNNTQQTFETSNYIIGYNEVKQTLFNVENTNSHNIIKNLLIAQFALCIIITILLSIGIIIGTFRIFGLQIISKIILLIALILMIIIFIIIQMNIIISSILLNRNAFEIQSISNGTGYYLILISIVLMLPNYIIYMLLA